MGAADTGRYIDNDDTWVALFAAPISAALRDAKELVKIGFLTESGEITAKARLRLRCYGVTPSGHSSGNVVDYPSIEEIERLVEFIWRGGVDRYSQEFGMPSVGDRILQTLTDRKTR